MRISFKFLVRVCGIIILILLPFFKTFANKIEQIYVNNKLSDPEKLDSIYYFYYQKAIPVEQLKIANTLISLATENNDFLWLYRAYYLKGNSYYFMAEPEKAYNNCLRSLEIAEKNKIAEGLNLIYNSLASILSLNNEHKKAIYYYKLASNLFLKNKDSINAGYTILNIVDEYHIIQKADSIPFYIESADSIFIKYNDGYGKAYVLGHKALYHATIGNNNLAEQYLKEAITVLNEVGQIYDIVAFEFEMGKILFDKGDLIKAKAKLLEVYNKSLSANLKAQIRDASELLSEINLKLGDYKNAHYYQSLFLAYKDSINNEETISKMADLRAEYEISQKQIEVDYLEKRRNINRITLTTTIVILIILFVLTYLLYRNNTTIKRQALELHDLNDTKDKMFSIISHDLRSPISSITSYFSFMKELAKNGEIEKLIRMSNEMIKSFQNISSLLDNLLYWATNQQQKIPYNPKEFYIHEICVPLINIFSNSAKAKGVTLHLEVDENIKLFADKNTFETIFRNLINNAIKFTKKGDSITLQCKELPDKIKFSVTDTGIGIPKEKLPTLFELKNNKSTWGTANEKGVGLGLRLVYEFTVLNKGNIYVDSEKDVGTTFTVEFPK